MKSVIFLLLVLAINCNTEEIEEYHQIGLNNSIGEAKFTFLTQRTLNKKSSDQPITFWSEITKSIFGP